MTLFNRGFKAMNEEKQRQEEERNRTKGLFRFFLTKDGEEADISFLTEQPINYHEHSIKTFKNGKERYENVPCIGEGCKHCENGDRPSFKSAWLIIDHREYEYTDKDGNKQEGSDKLRLMIFGTKVASILDKKSSKKGLVGNLYTITRLGKGTSTNYTIDFEEPLEFTEDEIRVLMTDEMSELYDGTMESLYTIVENQIVQMAGLSNENENDSSINEDLVNVDDEDEEEEEEEEQPKKKKGLLGKKNKATTTNKSNTIKSKSFKSKGKNSLSKKKLGRKENSVKRLLKNRKTR